MYILWVCSVAAFIRNITQILEKPCYIFECVSTFGCQMQTHMGVSKNSGTPNWMVYNGNPY